jgi:hypothetical protein
LKDKGGGGEGEGSHKSHVVTTIESRDTAASPLFSHTFNILRLHKAEARYPFMPTSAHGHVLHPNKGKHHLGGDGKNTGCKSHQFELLGISKLSHKSTR